MVQLDLSDAVLSDEKMEDELNELQNGSQFVLMIWRINPQDGDIIATATRNLFPVGKLHSDCVPLVKNMFDQFVQKEMENVREGSVKIADDDNQGQMPKQVEDITKVSPKAAQLPMTTQQQPFPVSISAPDVVSPQSSVQPQGDSKVRSLFPSSEVIYENPSVGGPVSPGSVVPDHLKNILITPNPMHPTQKPIPVFPNPEGGIPKSQ